MSVVLCRFIKDLCDEEGVMNRKQGVVEWSTHTPFRFFLFLVACCGLPFERCVPFFGVRFVIRVKDDVLNFLFFRRVAITSGRFIEGEGCKQIE